MKKTHIPMPYYIVKAIGILIVVCILIWLIRSFAAPPFDLDRHGYAIEQDPDSLYKQSMDSLPYYLYKKKTDSINLLQDHYRNLRGSTWYFGAFGIGAYGECDTCTYATLRYGPYETDDKYYFILRGFKSGKYPMGPVFAPVFYKKGGVSYMKYVCPDSLTAPDGTKSYQLRWTNKVIHYRVQNDDTDGHDDQKQLLIPVSAGMYRFLGMVYWIFLAGCLVLCWLWLRKLAQLLSAIAAGRAFTVDNYKRLYYMAYVTALVPGGILFIQVVLQLALWPRYGDDLVMDINWGSNIFYLLYAIIIFLIAKAFQRGYYIQQEQDLTI